MLATISAHTFHDIAMSIHGLRALAHWLPYWASIPLGAVLVFSILAGAFEALKGSKKPVPTGGICGGPTDPR